MEILQNGAVHSRTQRSVHSFVKARQLLWYFRECDQTSIVT